MRQLKDSSSRLGDTMNQGKRMWNILFLPPTSIPFSATLASVLALSGFCVSQFNSLMWKRIRLGGKQCYLEKKQKPSNH